MGAHPLQTLSSALQCLCLVLLVWGWYSSLFVTSFLLLVLCLTSLTGPYLSAGKGVYFTVLSTKVAYFSLINVGSGFHCLCSFSFLFVDGIVKGMLTPERLNILQRKAFENTTACMTTLTRPPHVLHRSSWASSLAKILLPPEMQAKKFVFADACWRPPHIITALQDRRDWTYTDGSFWQRRARHMIRCIPPLLKCLSRVFHYVHPRGAGITKIPSYVQS